jgi:HEPN domain-containing protein
MARLALGADIPSAAAFHLQQALEKGLKSLIIEKGRRVAKIHDLEVLADQAADPLLPFSTDELSAMSLWAMSGRYPDDYGSPPDNAELVVLSQKVTSSCED